MTGKHAVSQYSFLHRSALCPVHTQPHSIQSSIALPYAQSTRCPTVFTHTSLCPMPSPHAVPQYSSNQRSALCPVHKLSHSIQSSIALHYDLYTRRLTVFIPSSLCPMPSPHAATQYSFLHHSALCPVHTLSHSIHSSITLPYAQSTRCPTVFTHPSL
jgi:hypothetical protein